MKAAIGCGKRFYGEDWIHIDGDKNFPHVNSDDFYLFGYRGTDFSLIYASHFLEYFDYEEAEVLLTIWYDRLKYGGTLRIAVPDFKVIAWLYSSGKLQIGEVIGPICGKWQMGNRYVYHKSIFDFFSLKEMLERVGFKNVRNYDFRTTEHSHVDDHSMAHWPHDPEAIRTGNFTPNHILLSLNVECTK